ncbi:glycosidase domain protein, partial [Vibrio parahaemolyticus 3256]
VQVMVPAITMVICKG